MQNLSHGMHKCSETFEREMLCSNGFDTTTIAISGLKQGIDDLVLTIQDKINMVIGDLIEPLDFYYKQYMQSCNEELLKAKGCWSNLGE